MTDEETGSHLWSVLHDMNDAADKLKEHSAALRAGKTVTTDREAKRQLIASGIQHLRKLGKQYAVAVEELAAKYEQSKNN